MSESTEEQGKASCDEAARRLGDLTQSFYSRHAQSFSSSRQSPWPAWHALSPRSLGRVLDLGCGNGRFLKFMREAWGFEGSYVGMDSCPELLKEAARSYASAEQIDWQCRDILREPWPAGCFDLVVAWGLFHHVARARRRFELLLSMADALCPGGTMALSLWQFRKHARFAEKEVEPAAFGINASALEHGDALLDWAEDRSVPRYCHHFSDEEVAGLRTELLSARADLRAGALSTGEALGSDRYNAYLVFSRLA